MHEALPDAHARALIGVDEYPDDARNDDNRRRDEKQHPDKRDGSLCHNKIK